MTPIASPTADCALCHPLPRTGVKTWSALLFVTAAVFALELSLGSVLIPLRDVVSILLGHSDAPEGWRRIVLLFRLPRAITAMLAGAALAMAGLQMQTLFRNPLADPFVLGISSGASLGVALVVMTAHGLGWTMAILKSNLMGDTSMIAGAILGAVAVLSIVLGVARKVESNVTLLIIGLMFGYISSSVVHILMQFSFEHQMQNYIAWTFGSFGVVTWRQLTVFAPCSVVGLALGWALAKPLNAFLLGEGYARSMGVNVRRTKFCIIFGSALLAGIVTAYCGPIGFLGIAVPHLCRLILKTSDHHVLAPAVILLGATLAMLADLIAQLPGAQIALPLNSVTALIGAPIVVGVILRRRHTMEAGS